MIFEKRFQSKKMQQIQPFWKDTDGSVFASKNSLSLNHIDVSKLPSWVDVIVGLQFYTRAATSY